MNGHKLPLCGDCAKPIQLEDIAFGTRDLRRGEYVWICPACSPEKDNTATDLDQYQREVDYYGPEWTADQGE